MAVKSEVPIDLLLSQSLIVRLYIKPIYSPALVSRVTFSFNVCIIYHVYATRFVKLIYYDVIINCSGFRFSGI